MTIETDAAARTSDRLTRARTLAAAGTFAAAADLYCGLANEAPGDLKLQSEAYTVLRAAGCFREATRGLGRILEAVPAHSGAWVELGTMWATLRQWDAAAEALRTALKLGEEKVRLPLVEALKALGRIDEAAGAIETAPVPAPDMPGMADLFYQLGLLRRDQGRLAEAEACFSAALRHMPNKAFAAFHLCLTRRLRGAEGETSEDPFNLAAGHTEVGLRLAAEGKWLEAVARFHEALLYRPEFAPALEGFSAVMAAEWRVFSEGRLTSDKEVTIHLAHLKHTEAAHRFKTIVAERPAFLGQPRQSGSGRPRVFDGFTFFNELDLLELRLEELYDVVDGFILVESPWTFQHRPKPLHFLENRERFVRFADKIIHVVAEELRPQSTWHQEWYQRDMILRGLEEGGLEEGRLGGGGNDEDLIFISDVDEIPSRGAVEAVRSSPLLASRLSSLVMHNHSCFMDFRSNLRWQKASVLPVGLARRLGAEYARCLSGTRYEGVLFDAGWHYSWLGGIETVIAKFQAYSHVEMASLSRQPAEQLEAAMRSPRGLLGLIGHALVDGSTTASYWGEFQDVPVDASFPQTVQRDPDRFRRLGWFVSSLEAR